MLKYANLSLTRDKSGINERTNSGTKKAPKWRVSFDVKQIVTINPIVIKTRNKIAAVRFPPPLIIFQKANKSSGVKIYI